VTFNRVQTRKRVANSPTRVRGRPERAHTMLRDAEAGRDWKKSQQRNKSVRVAGGGEGNSKKKAQHELFRHWGYISYCLGSSSW
jgi:hypothetical protein